MDGVDGRFNRVRAAVAGRTETLWRAIQDATGRRVARGRRQLFGLLDGGYDPATCPVAPPSIACADLTVAYHGVTAIENVTVEFPPGSTTAVVGPNGGGKSTLLKAIAGILRPESGCVDDAGAPRHTLAYLPQSDDVDRSFPISTGEFVAFGAWCGFGAFAAAPAWLSEEIRRALATVGLEEAYDRPIAVLSVGQFRRVLFARLTLQHAPVLLLDEPFAGIDAVTTADLLRLIEGWNREGRTIIVVLHDLAQVRRHFRRSVLLAQQLIAAGDTDAVLTTEHLAAAGLGGAALDGA